MEIAELHTEMKTTFEQFKEVSDRLEGEVKEFGEGKSQTKEMLDKVGNRLDEIETKMKRVNLEANQDEPTEETKAGAAYVKAMRYGSKGMEPEELKLLATDDLEDGGVLMPVNKREELIRKLIEFSPIRAMANVISISQGDNVIWPAEGSTDFVADWTGEREASAETQSGTLRNEVVPVHELTATPFATQKLLEDSAFNVEAWLNDRLARRFAVTEGLAFVSGDADGKPEGLLTNTDVTSVNSGDANLLTSDGLVEIFYDLPEFYANNGTWIMKRASIKAIRLFKDGQGQFLWQPGLQPGQPTSILGRPVVEAIDMPTVSAGNFPIIFGDIRAAYLIVDRVQITVMRDPFTSKPKVEFFTRKRVGAQVILAEAIRKQKVSA